jgi:hypothetical protein
MGALTVTLGGKTEFSGDYKILKITCVPASASDTLTLTLASHGISEILGVFGHITTGQDAALAGIFCTFSGLVITVTTTASAGTAATDWTGATADVYVIGRSGT